MNIFILSKDLAENVKMHCDAHVRKQILEAAQIACTVHWLTGGKAPYRSTHKNHPLVRWACESMTAYKFTVKYGLALCEEFTYRWQGVHKTQAVLQWLSENPPNIPNAKTKYKIVVPDDCLVASNEEASYRNHYLKNKRHIAQWTRRPVPEWWT